MTDHCYNTVQVGGPAKEVAEFRRIMLVRKTSARLPSDDSELIFDFDALIPCPPEVLGTAGDRPWCEDNWWTEWPAYACRIASESETRLRVRFTTAWCAPEPIFIAMAARFPELTFQIRCEPDVGACLQINLKDGRETDRRMAASVDRLHDCTSDDDDEEELMDLVSAALTAQLQAIPDEDEGNGEVHSAAELRRLLGKISIISDYREERR